MSGSLRNPRSREWGRKFRRSFRGFDQSNGHIVGCACRASGAGSRVHIRGQQLAPSKSGQQFLPLNRGVRWADIRNWRPPAPNGHIISTAKIADQTFSVQTCCPRIWTRDSAPPPVPNDLHDMSVGPSNRWVLDSAFTTQLPSNI